MIEAIKVIGSNVASVREQALQACDREAIADKRRAEGDMYGVESLNVT